MKNESGAKGFTLLEVLLTIILVVVGFVALMQAFSVGLSAGDEEAEFVAIHLAQQRMEDLRNRSYANVINGTENPVPGFSGFSRAVTVSTAFPLPAGLKEVTITVSWGSPFTVSLVTYISDT